MREFRASEHNKVSPIVSVDELRSLIIEQTRLYCKDHAEDPQLRLCEVRLHEGRRQEHSLIVKATYLTNEAEAKMNAVVGSVCVLSAM